MALIFKPHSVTVRVPSTSADAATGEVAVMEHAAASSAIACKVEPISTDAALGEFGIEVERGFRLLCELTDASSFPVNARVIWSAGGMTLRTMARQEFRSFTGLTAHCSVLLTKEDEV